MEFALCLSLSSRSAGANGHGIEGRSVGFARTPRGATSASGSVVQDQKLVRGVGRCSEQTSESNSGEGSVLDQPVQDRHQPRKGASKGGSNERQRSCRSLFSTHENIP